MKYYSKTPRVQHLPSCVSRCIHNPTARARSYTTCRQTMTQQHSQCTMQESCSPPLRRLFHRREVKPQVRGEEPSRAELTSCIFQDKGSSRVLDNTPLGEMYSNPLAARAMCLVCVCKPRASLPGTHTWGELPSHRLAQHHSHFLPHSVLWCSSSSSQARQSSAPSLRCVSSAESRP